MGKDLYDEEIQWKTIKWVQIIFHTNKSEMLRIVLKLSCVGDTFWILVV